VAGFEFLFDSYVGLFLIIRMDHVTMKLLFTLKLQSITTIAHMCKVGLSSQVCLLSFYCFLSVHCLSPVCFLVEIAKLSLPISMCYTACYSSSQVNDTDATQNKIVTFYTH